MREQRSRLERRRLLVVSALVGAGALSACKRSETCPPEQLSPEELKLRETLKYTDRSTDRQKRCSDCQQYLPNSDADCGRCKLFKGAIHPDGYCAAFSAKG
jgi:hypothetical protein